MSFFCSFSFLTNLRQTLFFQTLLHNSDNKKFHKFINLFLNKKVLMIFKNILSLDTINLWVEKL